MTTPNINAQKRSFFQGRKMWFWTAAGLGTVTLVLLVLFLTNLTSTTTYFVLNRDLPARTLVTSDMLTPVLTNNGGQPPTALTDVDIVSGEVYTSIELSVGDILTASNAGDLVPLRSGIPQDYVIASFTANPNDSAGGNITRGDYVDIFWLDEDTTATLIFQRMLIVDASTDLANGAADETVTPTDGTATAPYRVGIPSLYTVGISQADAGKLALALSTGRLYTVLSSEQTVTDGATAKSWAIFREEMLSTEATDAGLRTDASFEKVDGLSTDAEPITMESVGGVEVDPETGEPLDPNAEIPTYTDEQMGVTPEETTAP